jgi:F-type H+-transporting ATPase subunit gamma
MASGRTLKNRIKATKSIKQITKAMEAVSAVKMRKSQNVALSARPYALTALEILYGISFIANHASLPLMEKRPVKRICLAVITSDKGLAGAFNSNVIRKAEKILKQGDKEFVIVAIGKKARDYFSKRDTRVVGEFVGAGDFGTISETKHISDCLSNLFLEQKCDETILIYTNFVSALKQEVVARKILPFSEESLKEIVDSITPLRGRYANMPKALGTINIKNSTSFIFEPSPTEILETLLPKLLEIQVFHAVLEANASEHSSRMIAMKNASENAGELIDGLNLIYNKARQALITKELAEITGGREALES